jgi:phosphohistidine phosphatase SixA
LLKREDLVPDIIISSTAIRARATSEAVASYDGEIVLEKSLYAAEPEAYLGTLCQMNMFEC